MDPVTIQLEDKVLRVQKINSRIVGQKSFEYYVDRNVGIYVSEKNGFHTSSIQAIDAVLFKTFFYRNSDLKTY